MPADLVHTPQHFTCDDPPWAGRWTLARCYTPMPKPLEARTSDRPEEVTCPACRAEATDRYANTGH